MLKRLLYSFIKKYLPSLWYFLDYRYASKKMGDTSKKREGLFRKLIYESNNKKCLQIGVHEKKYAPHWISDDLYCYDETIDFHYDVCNLMFESETFDVAVCIAILEHVEDPRKAIKELHRVLKKGGLIWVEVPLNQPYHPSPNDYWRVTLQGMQIWMRSFKEISSGFFKINGSPIYNSIYF